MNCVTRTALIVPCAIALTIPIAGCNYSDLISDVNDFKNSVTIATKSLETTYNGINDYYRNTYVSNIRYDVEEKVAIREQDETFSDLVYHFDPIQVRARVLVLRGLAEYSAGVAALASSDAPDQAQQLAAQLSERVTNTANTLSNLKKSDGSPFQISQYSKPIANLARIAAKYWVRRVQVDEIKNSIKEGSPIVISTLDALENDLHDSFKDAYINNVRLQLINQKDYFNNSYVLQEPKQRQDESNEEFEDRRILYEQTKTAMLKDKDRVNCLNELSTTAKELADLQATSPIPIIESLREAHKSLLKYVDKPPKSKILRDQARGAASSVLESIRSVSATLTK